MIFLKGDGRLTLRKLRKLRSLLESKADSPREQGGLSSRRRTLLESKANSPREQGGLGLFYPIDSPREQGGLGLFYPIDFIMSLKVSLIGKLLDNSFNHAWKDIITDNLSFQTMLLSVSRTVCWQTNRGGFSENLLSSYQEWKLKCSIAGDCTVNHCVWGTGMITDIGSSLWNTELIYKGIMYLTDFITENGEPLPYSNFLRRWDCPVARSLPLTTPVSSSQLDAFITQTPPLGI